MEKIMEIVAKIKKLRKKPKRAARWELKTKSLYLTYSCPVEAEKHPFTKEELHAYLKSHAKLSIFNVHVIATEIHKTNGNEHIHAYLETTGPKFYRTKNEAHIDFKGLHPNNRARIDGKKVYSKIDWLEYITKDFDYLQYNIDVPTYMKLSKSKKASKMSLVATKIQQKGYDFAKFMEDPDTAGIVLMHGDKMEALDKKCKQLNIRKNRKTPVKIDLRCTKKPHEKNLLEWWNKRCVEGVISKEIGLLYLWSKIYSVGKSTLLSVMGYIMNGTRYTWETNDRKWQEDFSNHDRLLCIDAMQDNSVPCAMLEKLGFNIPVKIPRRHNTDPQWLGPVSITSNSSLDKWYPKQFNMLMERTFSMELTAGQDCFNVINILIKAHKLDPKMFYKKPAKISKRLKRAIAAGKELKIIHSFGQPKLLFQ